MKTLIKAITPEWILQMYRNARQKSREARERALDEERKMAFYREIIAPGDLCFDVGANMGNRIRPFLEIGAKVVAVEPQDQCVEVLRSEFGNKIQLVTKGLAAEEGVQELYVSDSHTISSFSKDWIDAVKQTRFSRHEWNETRKIQMTTLDKLIEEFGKPHFIKIDVEGFELEVLKGLSTPVHLISIEYTVPEQTAKAIACVEQIMKNGGDPECNFSVGESMRFELDRWLPAAEMIRFMATEEFQKTDFGDIYIRLRK